MNEESSTQTDRKRKKQVFSQVGSQLASYPGCISLRKKKGSSKRLAAASFFAYKDKRMVVRVLHLGAFILYYTDKYTCRR